MQTREGHWASVTSRGQLGHGDSRYPSISDDGRYVAFQSSAQNLTPRCDAGD